MGGLGAKDGSPVIYAYTVPSLMPQALPWVLVLVLLALPRNRFGQAWWVLVPLLSMYALEFAGDILLEMMPSQPRDLLCQMFNALGFGSAALWLLSPYFSGKHRFLTFLGMLLSLEAASIFAFAVRQDTDEWILVVGFMVYLAVSAAMLPMAISLGSLMCRRKYSPLRFMVWFAVWLAGGLMVLAIPFVVIAAIAAGGELPLFEVFVAVLVLAGVLYLSVLPFVSLSFANTFWRERLKTLLHVAQILPTPTVNPPPPVEPAATPSNTPV